MEVCLNAYNYSFSSSDKENASADHQSTRKADCNSIKTVSEVRKGLCAVPAAVCASEHQRPSKCMLQVLYAD